ncbi:11410_t:CDS:1, partial [Dentiscutata erythropus]
ESDWILSDEFGLQELLILIRSGTENFSIREKRISEWLLNYDPDIILEQFKPDEILNEIKSVFVNVNDELDKLEL